MADKQEMARRLALAVSEYNQNNPDSPITEQDIQQKSRHGLAGRALLFCEGVWDGITDKIPEDVARLFRHGEIGARPDDWRERTIATQKRDQARRIPSYEEATGDASAMSAYHTGREIPTNIAAGLPGALAGAAGGIAGSAAGSALTTGAAYGSIARDRFIEAMHERFRTQNGRLPNRIEAAQLNGAANASANSYAQEQALGEGVAQLATALPGGALVKQGSRFIGRAMANAGQPARLAGQGAGVAAGRTVENIAGEGLSPERDIAAEQIYRGLEFTRQNGRTMTQSIPDETTYIQQR